MATPDALESVMGAARSETSLATALKTVVKSLSQAVDRRLAPYDLTDAQSLPLLMLANEGCRTPGELAQRLQCDSGSLVRALDRLEAKGMLTRARSPTDRRVVEICLTAVGRDAAAKIPDVVSEVMTAHLTDFTDSERSLLLAMLTRMRLNVTERPCRAQSARPRTR
jgi:DNA-binding MarR family transcriptional regulator